MDSLNKFGGKDIRITVLMAIYNCASTLEEALDSLFRGQTYQGFKVVLCDDCSNDNTYDVAKEYAQRYPDRILLLRNESNEKLPATLNKCLEHADTEYVARMDGDDISKPERFEKEINFLDSNKAFGFVSCPMEYFNENGVFMTGKAVEEPNNMTFVKDSPFAHAPVMMRTDILRAVGGYTVKPWTRRGQDVHLWAKLMNAGFRGFNLDIPLYQMRDDMKAYKRRNFKEAILAVRRTYEVYNLVSIPKRYYYRIFRRLIVDSLPRFIYDYFHTRRFNIK